MSDFVVEMWPIERIQDYTANPRKIPERAVGKVARSIRLTLWEIDELPEVETCQR